MSVNAINNLSLYEYYYKINNNNKSKKSAVEKINEDNIRENIQNVKENNTQTQEISKQDRPWADVMYQLNLTFNEDAKDDIQDIKVELDKLLKQADNDEELSKDIKDLENYVQNLYIDYKNTTAGTVNLNNSFTDELNAMSMMNKVQML